MSNIELSNAIEHVTIPRNYFNRDEKLIASLDAGVIYPLYAKLMLPNDAVELENEVVIRQQPTISPSFSNFIFRTRAFVVSIRNLNKDFYRWLSGYKEYSTMTKYDEPLHYWKPSNISKTAPGTLWDFLGYPTDCIPDDNNLPWDYYRQAYGYFWDTFMRNQTIQESILNDGEPNSWKGEDLLRVNWDRDYFTTGLPFQQLSDPIGLPIVGNTKAVWNNNVFTSEAYLRLAATDTNNEWQYINTKDVNAFTPTTPGVPGETLKTLQVQGNTPLGNNRALVATQALDQEPGWHQHHIEIDDLNNNTVSMENISSVLISDMRYAFALQLLAEMNARGGIRDNEVLLSHYGTAPTDETLGRPYYLGSTATNVITSEVLQTSETTQNEPLGQMAGHGLGVSTGGKIKYRAKEFCILMVIGYIKPTTIYGGQGMPAEYRIRSRFEIPLPVLQHLSEQPIKKAELLCASTVFPVVNDNEIVAGNADPTAENYNNEIFAYRPIFDWLRYSQDRIAGLLKRRQGYTDATGATLATNINQLSNWTEARFFSIKNGERPALNNDFLQLKLDNRNYSIVDDTIERAQFLIWYNQKANWWRPATLLGTPGRIDHII